MINVNDSASNKVISSFHAFNFFDLPPTVAQIPLDRNRCLTSSYSAMHVYNLFPQLPKLQLSPTRSIFYREMYAETVEKQYAQDAQLHCGADVFPSF